jgi:transcription initiation factor IIE alpha subunit
MEKKWLISRDVIEMIGGHLGIHAALVHDEMLQRFCNVGEDWFATKPRELAEVLPYSAEEVARLLTVLQKHNLIARRRAGTGVGMYEYYVLEYYEVPEIINKKNLFGSGLGKIGEKYD